MTASVTAIDRLDWAGIARQLDIEGHAMLPGLMPPGRCRELASAIDRPGSLRHVSLAESNLGRGDLFCFGEQLPEPLPAWRAAFYRYLAPIADRWNEVLDVPCRYPARLDDFLRRNREAGQAGPLSHLIRLDEAQHLAFHQHEGEHVFPLVVVVLLTEPGRDFEGGEFVMTEQRPRMQSRPMVLPLRSGDVAIIGTAQRPLEGRKGYYRARLRHAISRVRRGTRIGLELSFHDAPLPAGSLFDYSKVSCASGTD